MLELPPRLVPCPNWSKPVDASRSTPSIYAPWSITWVFTGARDTRGTAAHVTRLTHPVQFCGLNGKYFHCSFLDKRESTKVEKKIKNNTLAVNWHVHFVYAWENIQTQTSSNEMHKTFKRKYHTCFDGYLWNLLNLFILFKIVMLLRHPWTLCHHIFIF